jgi:hypothetical protein
MVGQQPQDPAERGPRGRRPPQRAAAPATRRRPGRPGHPASSGRTRSATPDLPPASHTRWPGRPRDQLPCPPPGPGCASGQITSRKPCPAIATPATGTKVRFMTLPPASRDAAPRGLRPGSPHRHRRDQPLRRCHQGVRDRRTEPCRRRKLPVYLSPSGWRRSPRAIRASTEARSEPGGTADPARHSPGVRGTTARRVRRTRAGDTAAPCPSGARRRYRGGWGAGAFGSPCLLSLAGGIGAGRRAPPQWFRRLASADGLWSRPGSGACSWLATRAADPTLDGARTVDHTRRPTRLPT